MTNITYLGSCFSQEKVNLREPCAWIHNILVHRKGEIVAELSRSMLHVYAFNFVFLCTCFEREEFVIRQPSSVRLSLRYGKACVLPLIVPQNTVFSVLSRKVNSVNINILVSKLFGCIYVKQNCKYSHAEAVNPLDIQEIPAVFP